ncbi:MAG TPA: OmpA family protein [Labilithrix sp.]|nr:OmpA family protein [Labilithrix sp.]
MRWILVALAASSIGCAPTRAPNQLVDARIAYQQASSHPSASMVGAELYSARQTLDQAEKAFADGDMHKAKNLAYIAHRKAIALEAREDTIRAIESKRLALAEFEQFREAQAQATREEIERAKESISKAEQEAQAERQARAATEEKVKEVEGVAVTESDRGLVVTLSGGVLFGNGKAQLLPDAKQRLSEVASALKDDRRTLLIVGHTDSQGADEANEKLSAARADSVRAYLVEEGIDESRIRSEGMGEALPVADNRTPEGRANNRRVEVVLENSPGSGHVEPPPKSTEPEKKGKAKATPKKK